MTRPSTLRYASEPGVDEPVGPAVPERFEFVDQEPHRFALVEHEHVAHVLEHQQRHALVLDEAEHLAYQARCCACDALRAAGLGEVGARESSGDEVDVGQPVELLHVAHQGHAGESFCEDRLGRVPPLAQKVGPGPALVESELDASDASEQTGDAERSGGSHGLQTTRLKLDVDMTSLQCLRIEECSVHGGETTQAQ